MFLSNEVISYFKVLSHVSEMIHEKLQTRTASETVVEPGISCVQNRDDTHWNTFVMMCCLKD
jgi:hypothetical protein